MQLNKIIVQNANEAQKRRSIELAAQKRSQRREEEASILWRRMVANAVYRRTQITDPSVMNWLFVGLLSVTHMASGVQVPLPQLEQQVSMLIPDLQVYDDGGGQKEQRPVELVQIRSEGPIQGSEVHPNPNLVDQKIVVTMSDLRKESSNLVLKVQLDPIQEPPRPKVRLGGAQGNVRISALRGYIPSKSPDSLAETMPLGEGILRPPSEAAQAHASTKNGETAIVKTSERLDSLVRHYSPLLGDDYVRVHVPESEEAEIIALSQASFNLPQFFHMEELQEWRYACIERTFEDLVEGDVLKMPVLTRTGIYSKGHVAPQDFFFLYFKENRLKVCTNRFLQWRNIHWNNQPYQYNLARTLWKLERASRFLLSPAHVAHMGHDPGMHKLMASHGHTYLEWWSWEKMPKVSALLCFHSLHHAGYHSLKVINDQGPEMLIVQEHGSQLSEDAFYEIHEQYGDHPRYLAQIGTPALERGFKNYILVYLEERKGKDLFLVYLRKKDNSRGLIYRGDDPGQGWSRQNDSYYRKASYPVMRKVVSDLVLKGKPFSIVMG